jgi:stearoyl-CoA desaturase (delta-9 desaturase)
MQNISKPSTIVRGVNWKNVTIIASIHLMAIPAIFSFSLGNLATLLISNWIVGSLGVGLGYHRLLTHRSFTAPKWLEYFLTMLGTMSMQDSPDKWVATHRLHHRFTETEDDPHSTSVSLLWAQTGWIVWGKAQDHNEETLQRYVPDLKNDRIHELIARFWYVPVLLTAVGSFAIGGWSMVVWCVFARIVVGWHTTWFVNSLSHSYGKRAFDTDDDSTNNWFVALITFGEGWHNNHHAHPTSARHGLKWYQFDMNWLTLRFIERLGIVHGLKVPK